MKRIHGLNVQDIMKLAKLAKDAGELELSDKTRHFCYALMGESLTDEEKELTDSMEEKLSHALRHDLLDKALAYCENLPLEQHKMLPEDVDFLSELAEQAEKSGDDIIAEIISDLYDDLFIPDGFKKK